MLRLRRIKAVWRVALLTLVSATLAAGCAKNGAPKEAEAAAPAIPYDREKSLESFEVVWQTVNDKHWDLSGVDWTAVHTEFRPRAEAAQSTEQMRRVMRDMLERLGQSHFGIWPREAYLKEKKAGEGAVASAGSGKTDKPADAATTGEAKPDAKPESDEIATDDGDDSGYLGIDVRVRAEEAMVTRVDAGSPAELAGIRPGFLVTSVEGQRVDRILKRFNAEQEAALSRELVATRVLSHLLSGDVGQTLQLDVVDGDERSLSKKVTLARPVGTPATFPNMPTFYLTIDSKRLPPPQNIQYFGLSMFMDFQRVMAAYQKAVEEAQTSEGLIIDLRGNPGGIGGMAMAMGGWLIDEDHVKLGTMTTRNGTINFVVNPRVRTYAGPVAILIDGLSASTSEIFAGGMKDARRARIFGQRTAGAALPSVFEMLPNGDRFQYAVANYVSASGKRLEGEGVAPDVEIAPDRASLLQGRDVVLEAAIAWIKSGAPMESATTPSESGKN